MRVRTALFWCHLVAGVTAGLLIFLMCVTGVLLTYERQLIEWSDRQFVSTPPSPDAARLRASALLERAEAQEGGDRPTGITLRADADEPVAIAFGQRIVYADAFTGEIIGAPTTGIRELMSALRGWHRWLAMEGDQRATARLVTGWANVLFLFIVLSGMYLWLPRVWTAAQVRAVALFRSGLQGKARDFNWHNVIGIWSAVPLAIVVATAMPISFPWANALVYRVVGEDPPAQGQGGPGGRREQAEVDPLPPFNTLDARWAQAEGQVEGWRSINLRVPARSGDPLVFLIDEGNGGQPQLRSTLTLEAGTGSIVTWEPFDALSPGRQLRSWSRFTHTGEAFGLTGQTIAGLASGGGAVLVWTGLALALRRFVGWRSRQRRPALSPAQPDLSGVRPSFISASMARHEAAEAAPSDRSLTQPGVVR